MHVWYVHDHPSKKAKGTPPPEGEDGEKGEGEGQTKPQQQQLSDSEDEAIREQIRNNQQEDFVNDFEAMLQRKKDEARRYSVQFFICHLYIQ